MAAAFHGGSVGAIFYPLSQTASDATPLVLTGLSVAIAFRAGLFNIGAAGQWVGGAIVATYLGFGVSLPPVIHVIVCLIGGFAGGAVIGWIVGELKARTGAHEVIVTIMLNYIMYNFLSLPARHAEGAAAARPVQPDQPDRWQPTPGCRTSAGRRRRSTPGSSSRWPPPPGVWWLLSAVDDRVPSSARWARTRARPAAPG